ncbi:MAG: type III secretion system effector protein exou [Pseudomonas lactis]|jgi:exoenzyme U|uniref:patatin-like phospholipase family protein n=1 Tax=Pseudomonas TaxID=286 RepID=UPI001F16320D|nr:MULTISPECIES: patatin-like phospholipase family protein [unclassified Pseudomonas]NLT86989.1 type III secretion system effector protein exou [Pseudomonas lactis]MCF5506443.1 type III secretion system effector protein exou [Pseudomonas sp. PA-3-6H]MCF5512669.1 type III secretion system effector protein exou [Pseudomonas sp. PA-3-6E]MCF5559346.1 type III secretion system effector protein exou [Pseudomonas sp. PA-3-5D]MCF5565530.1 type III secretion system effector protein exou [Pseudomonas sp
MKVSSSVVENHPPSPQISDQGAKVPLVKGVGERNLSIYRHSDGRVEVVVSPPPPAHLVLSGGGAKGIAFPGMVQALEEADKLKGVKVVSGSSAGAICAALLASGMDAKAFTQLSNNLDLPRLLNSKDPVTAWLQEASSELGKLVRSLPGPVGNISQLLLTLLPRLQTEGQPLEDLIRNESRQSILAHIAGMPPANRPPEVTAIAERLSAGGGATFRDLEVLSRHIPAIKQLNITGTGMFDGRPQLVVFNANLTPDMDIGRAALISGALPGLFKSPTEQGHGFQAASQVTAFQDGGLLLNTPAPGVIERSFPESPLGKDEALIVKFESDKASAPPRSGGFFSFLADTFTGTPHTAAESYQNDRLQAFSEQTVTLPLNSDKGDFRGLLGGTVNFTMTPEQKQHLQAQARQAVSGHLQQRELERERHEFPSLNDAVMAMDDQMLASVQVDLQNDAAGAEALRFRKDTQQALQALDTAIAEANQTSTSLVITPKLASALRNLDALARRPEDIEWLGKRLNAPGQRNFQQLLQVGTKQASSNGSGLSKVLTSAVAEMQKRDIGVKAENFIREVIYPSLYRPGQPAANVELLQRAVRDLGEATTPAEFNRVLDGIVKHYRARNKPWSKPFSSTTVEQAKAWRIPV